MTRVVVHIGAQRTGSEAIHRGLFTNEDVLACGPEVVGDALTTIQQALDEAE